MSDDDKKDDRKNEPGDRQDLVDEANAALEHIEATPGKWFTVIDCYEHGRSLAMVRSGSNTPHGKGYAIALRQWAERTGFNLSRIDEQARASMGKIIDDRAAFDDWYKSLMPSQRQMWNHPRTLLRHFEKSKRAPKVVTSKTPKDELRDENCKLRAELAVLEAVHGKAADTGLLVDLDKDSADDIVEVMMQHPKALRDPRKLAEIGRKLAGKAQAALKRKAHASDPAKPKS